MTRRLAHVLFCIALLSAFVLPLSASAKMEEWQDLQGSQFRGEPIKVLGPYAVFRTGKATGRMVNLRRLSSEDCVRFHDRIRNAPPVAKDWSQSRSEVTTDLRGNVQRLDGESFAPVDFRGQPEPEFYILFFASQGEGKSWEMMSKAAPYYWKLRESHPGIVEGIFYGVNHGRREHFEMAKSLRVPWLVLDANARGNVSSLDQLAPDSEGYGLVVVTREGVPLISSQAENDADIKTAMNSLQLLIEALQPDNAKTWGDRAHYLASIQPVIYAKAYCDPILVGNPLLVEGLRKRSIFQLDASLQIAADGTITSVIIKNKELLPQKMLAPLTEALQRAVIIPAVNNGKYVEATFDYHIEVPKL